MYNMCVFIHTHAHFHSAKGLWNPTYFVKVVRLWVCCTLPVQSTELYEGRQVHSLQTAFRSLENKSFDSVPPVAPDYCTDLEAIYMAHQDWRIHMPLVFRQYLIISESSLCRMHTFMPYVITLVIYLHAFFFLLNSFDSVPPNRCATTIEGKTRINLKRSCFILIFLHQSIQPTKINFTLLWNQLH